MTNPEWDNYAPPPQRYCIRGDGSGHKYYIRVEEISTFEAWVDSNYESTGYEGPDYTTFRIDGRFTFTDPRCD